VPKIHRVRTRQSQHKVQPSYFLIRGNPDSKAYPTKRGFLSVLTTGNQPTELPPAYGRTSISYHDFHATILALLGIEHTKLTYRYNGRDMRLTDVAGELIPQIVG
jgi:hypothetical protein